MTTKGYQIETPAELWRGYDILVPQDRRITDRIVCLMAVDVLEHQHRCPAPTVEAAQTVLQEADMDLGGLTDGLES